MIILDTNVISEFTKESPDPKVVLWVEGLTPEHLYTTTITVAEMRQGIAMKPAGRRRRALEQSVGQTLEELFEGRILPFDREAAEEYGGIVEARRRTFSEHLMADCMIAAIARARGMAVATRNVRDFAGCGVDVVNPWAGA